jgi:hypothetical protein
MFKKISIILLTAVVIGQGFYINKLVNKPNIIQTKYITSEVQAPAKIIYKDISTDYEKLTLKNYKLIDIELQKIMPSIYKSDEMTGSNLTKNKQINELDFLKENSLNLKNSFDEYGGFIYGKK